MAEPKLTRRKATEYQSGFFGAVLTGSGSWSIRLNAVVEFTVRGKPFEIPYQDILEARAKSGIVWSGVHISTRQKAISLDGIDNNAGRDLVNDIQTRVRQALLESVRGEEKAMSRLVTSYDALLEWNAYLAFSDVEAWQRAHRQGKSRNDGDLVQTLSHPLFPLTSLTGTGVEGLEKLIRLLSGNLSEVEAHNEAFVRGEIARYRTFFDQVEKTPLTDEQCRAAVVMDDHNQMVAAAGSGKTSSIVGKVGYALVAGLYQPEDILVLAFNVDAAEELDERIRDRLGPVLRDKIIKAKTFHALGLEVIAKAEGVKPMIPDFASDPFRGRIVIGEIIRDLAEKPAFALDLALLHAVYFKPARDPASFDSEADWTQYLKETAEYEDQRFGYRTLNGELVKSQGELAIANWLFVHGVTYEYEKPYRYATATEEYRQYCPDFTFPDIGAYLEHYALDANGNPPPAFGRRYAESMAWKTELHRTHNTDLIETTFVEFVAGGLFPKLEEELVARGVKLKKRTSAEVKARLAELVEQQQDEFISLLQTFIKHAKSNRATASQIQDAAELHPQRARSVLFAKLATKVMAGYQKRLDDAGGVDFEDMIIRAADHLASGKYKHPWKLILVDEYQDASRARAELIKGMLGQGSGIKLSVVGDDWQSIYGFTAADVGLFTGFKGYFGSASVSFLTRTFRSNQGIANIAAGFIQKNPDQIRKEVKAASSEDKDVVVVVRVPSRNDVGKGVAHALDLIAGDAARRGKGTKRVFLLGRYRHLEPENLDALKAKHRNVLDLVFNCVN